MAMMAMQASGTGIRTILTSMILKPFLYVVAVVSAAQTAGDGVDGKNIAGFNALLADFHSFFQNRHQHFTLRNAIYYGRKRKCVIERQIPGFAYHQGGGRVLIRLDRRVYRLANRR